VKRNPRTRSQFRYIDTIEPIENRGMQCIQVDSASHRYLIGRSCLQTHNSELAAAIALLLTCGDGEERAEVYGCAADRQQASIVFEVAADMVRMCPALSKRVKILASTKRIIYLHNSFYQVLSAEAYSKHGFNVHGVVFDELHTQPNRKLFDVMTKGSGDARLQPLYFLITTAGTDTQSICYETHQKALDILEGRKQFHLLSCDLRRQGGRGLDGSQGVEESQSFAGDHGVYRQGERRLRERQAKPRGGEQLPSAATESVGQAGGALDAHG
jgi:hypothetical protein